MPKNFKCVEKNHETHQSKLLTQSMWTLLVNCYSIFHSSSSSDKKIHKMYCLFHGCHISCHFWWFIYCFKLNQYSIWILRVSTIEHWYQTKFVLFCFWDIISCSGLLRLSNAQLQIALRFLGSIYCVLRYYLFCGKWIGQSSAQT